MARLLFLAAVLALGAALALGLMQSPPTCTRCNVILISVDTLGAAHLSLYDPSLDTMPFLREEAHARGVTFERAYSQAPWTLPSHAAMLTGHYPWDLGIWEFLDALPRSAETIAERLSSHGYRTALFSMGSFVQKEWQFDQGFSIATGSMAVQDWNDTPLLFDEAGGWVEAHSKEPFFLFLRPFEAHDPYRDGTDIHDIVAENLRESGPRPEESARFAQSYQDDLARIDSALESLFERLERLGIASTTVVIVTSDHGEEFGEHGTAGLHGTTVYGESLHVPLVVFVPGASPRRVAATVEVRSLAPTIAALVGAGSSLGNAPSLVPYLSGDRDADMLVRSRTAISREQHLRTIEKAYAQVDAVIAGQIIPKERVSPFTGTYTEGVREGSRFALRTMGGATFMYDTASDPGEAFDLLPYSASLPFGERVRFLALLGALDAR